MSVSVVPQISPRSFRNILFVEQVLKHKKAADQRVDPVKEAIGDFFGMLMYDLAQPIYLRDV